MMNSKNKKTLFLSILGLILVSTSCGKVDEDSIASDLQVTMTPSKTIIIPEGDTTECDDGDSSTEPSKITAPYAQFRKIEFVWSKPTRFDLISIKLVSTSPALGGSFSQVIAGDQLNNAIGSSNVTITEDTARDTDGKVTITNTCALKFSGFSIKNKKISSTASARIILSGIETDSEGNETFVQGEDDVELSIQAEL